MRYKLLDRIKGCLFKSASEVYLHKTFQKAVLYLSRNRGFNYLNYLKALREIKRSSNKPPAAIDIESINLCNARCTMCTVPAMKRARGSMNKELFEKIVKDASRSGIELINLQNMGEPFLDRDLFERVRFVKRCGLQVMFHTNGSLMDEEKAKLLIETGVDIVTISLDALSKETYERIRKGLPFEEVTKNVMNLMETKRKKKAPLPVVKLNYAILNENLHEVKGFYDFWNKRVDHVNFNFAMDWAGQLDVSSSISWHITKHVPPLNPCDMLWKVMVVLHDGRVALCCYDYEGRVIMGDLSKQGIMEVWQGEKFQEYRKGHIGNKRGSLPLCNRCSKYSFWF